MNLRQIPHIQQAASSGTAIGITQSIGHITVQRDRKVLAQALVSTLDELIPGKQIKMYQISPSKQGDKAILIAENDFSPVQSSTTEISLLVAERPDFEAALLSGNEYIQSINGRISNCIYPIAGKHGIAALLDMTASQNDLELPLIRALLKVYCNYLTILDESETDTLTGLLNRRTFDKDIEKIITEHNPSDLYDDPEASHPIRRAENLELPHWLAIIDIDHFKNINDKFGHLYGDEVLLLLAGQMRRAFRQRDKLFRFGGEEFVIVLDRVSEENARMALDRFREIIASYPFPQVGQVTISIGFVGLSKADIPSSLIGRADQALYYAKQHGRNQVCQYEHLITSGNLTSQNYSDDVELF